MDPCHYVSLFSVAGTLPAGFVLGLCARVWASQPKLHRVQGSWCSLGWLSCSSSACPSFVLGQTKQITEEESPHILILLPVAGIDWESLWGCFLSLCNVPLQDRDGGHSCPIPLANNQMVFYWFRGKFDLRTLSSFPALWCQCQACGTSPSNALEKGVGGLLIPRNTSWEGP